MPTANDTPNANLDIAIVGVGPRGLSVLERIMANERNSAYRNLVTVHLVDPHAPGPGRVWRTDQSPRLLMNTVTSQVTAYTDPTVEMEGPVEPGPSLWDWIRRLRGMSRREAADSGYEDVLEEVRGLGPDSYPSRALYGRYLEYVFDRLVSGAPPHVRVLVHRSLAVSLDDEYGNPGGAQTLLLDTGERIGQLDAVVLCLGHVGSEPTKAEARLRGQAREHGLLLVPPGNPADHDLSGIEPGRTLLLRGLGLNFFDYMALLTVGRGGVFERHGKRLSYVPSGREPLMVAGSRRGVPHHGRGENEKGPYLRHTPRALTPDTIGALRRRIREGDWVRFSGDLWPLIAREVESTYYAALLTQWGRGEESAALVADYLAAPTPEAVTALLDRAGIAPRARWDWTRIAAPQGDRTFAGQDEYRSWLLDHLREDLRRSRAGNVTDPVKAALDVLRDLRNEVRLAVDHRGLEGNSHRDELQGWYTPLNAFLSIGPPASRVEEMIALIEAGVLDVLGPGMSVGVDTSRGVFTATSRSVGAAPVTATALIEARLPEPNLERTTDPLLRHLRSTGQCAAYVIPGECGTEYKSGGLAVTERPYHLLDERGRAHPRRFAYGIPTESVHWVTAAGIRPGVSSVILTDSDAIARTVLSLEPVLGEPGTAEALPVPVGAAGGRDNERETA